MLYPCPVGGWLGEPYFTTACTLSQHTDYDSIKNMSRNSAMAHACITSWGEVEAGGSEVKVIATKCYSPQATAAIFLTSCSCLQKIITLGLLTVDSVSQKGCGGSLEPTEVSSHCSHSSHLLNSVLICMWPGALGRLGKIKGRRSHLHSCGETIIHTGCRLHSFLSGACHPCSTEA